MKSILLWTCIVLLLAGCQMIETGRFEVQSPDGNLRVEVSLNEEGQPFYQTYYQGEMVLDTSLLGLERRLGRRLDREWFSL